MALGTVAQPALMQTVGRHAWGGAMLVVRADERRIERWLEWLRDGSEPNKISARRGLAGVFEQRGMLNEAIELLESNVEAGVRGAETLRWLSRLYQAQGDEARSLEAAVNASQHQVVSLVSEPPGIGEIEAEPTGPRAIRRLMPYFLMMVGLGITVGVVLWTLTPSWKP
jgi:hypothetical protein